MYKYKYRWVFEEIVTGGPPPGRTTRGEACDTLTECVVRLRRYYMPLFGDVTTNGIGNIDFEYRREGSPHWCPMTGMAVFRTVAQELIKPDRSV